jgi:hypothetical protein
MDESKEALLEYFLILYRETPPPHSTTGVNPNHL